MSDAVEIRAREIVRDTFARGERISWQEAIEKAEDELEPAEKKDVKYLQVPIPNDTRPQSMAYFQELMAMWDLHIRKATGYSGHSDDVWANFRTSQGLGVPDEIGAYIRMNDKFNRLKSLVQNPKRDLVNEPIEDLLADIAAYAIIAKLLRAEARSGT